MQKKPRGIAQTSPETSPSFDEALEQVADGLEHCGIPRDAAAVLAQGTIAAFQELAADKGVENAVESVRRGVLRIVEVEDGRRLNAVTEQEREEPVISINRDELLEVSADDFGGRLGSLLKEIEKGSCYSVSRNGQEIAWLLPLKQGEAIYVPTDFVSSTDINRSAGTILAQIAAGACLFVTRNNNKIAVLAPPQPDTPESLSPEAKLKAAYTAGVTPNDVKKLVTMFRDGIVGLSLDLGELGSVQITTLNQTGNKR
jgi:antitoxin (DNA-binding transcriptional repressor) of toxin-antitoxin stability system